MLVTTPISNAVALPFETNGTITTAATTTTTQSNIAKKYICEFDAGLSIICAVIAVVGIGLVMLSCKVQAGQSLAKAPRHALRTCGIGLGCFAGIVSTVCGIDTYIINKT